MTKRKAPGKAKRATIAIYALVDPRDGCERYIGKAKDPQKRLCQHLREAQRRPYPLYAWIRKLARLGMVPQLRVLRTVAEDEWASAEREEIERRRTDLFHRRCLLNVADGGEQPGSTAAQRSRNGHAMCAKIAADPRLQRQRHFKTQVLRANKEGRVSARVRLKLFEGAQRHPALMDFVRKLYRSAPNLNEDEREILARVA